jgi:hypothetical protein
VKPEVFKLQLVIHLHLSSQTSFEQIDFAVRSILLPLFYSTAIPEG